MNPEEMQRTMRYLAGEYQEKKTGKRRGLQSREKTKNGEPIEKSIGRWSKEITLNKRQNIQLNI